MLLLFLTPVRATQQLFFESVPSRSLVHCVLFWGFVHLWVCALKKQSKYEFAKRKAFLIVFVAAAVLAVISELGVYLLGSTPHFIFWNLAFDFIGAGLGLITFRLLYASCY